MNHIDHLQQPEAGEFRYFLADQQAGVLRYRYVSSGVIDAFSTKVEDAFQGQGIAAKLYDALIEFVRANQLKVRPSCHYIEVKMDRSHPELRA